MVKASPLEVGVGCSIDGGEATNEGAPTMASSDRSALSLRLSLLRDVAARVCKARVACIMVAEKARWLCHW